LKRDGVETKDIEHHLIKGGEELHERELRRLLTLDYEDLLKALSEYSYWKVIEEAIERRSLVSAETRLERYGAEYAHKLSYYYPLSILPVIGYIISKKHEIHNLHLIARAKELGIPSESVEEQLVI
jgi:V/A-type H+-transporting ATPase subunit C